MALRIYVASAFALVGSGTAYAGSLHDDGLATAAPGIAPSTILFECHVGGKNVRITSAGDRLTYRYGTTDEAELTLSETAAGGNVFYMAQRYAGMQYQLRFVSGDTSYIVFASEGNAHVGADSSSGLVVMRGTDRIMDKPCARYSEFSADFEYSTLPEDSKTYSAM